MFVDSGSALAGFQPIAHAIAESGSHLGNKIEKISCQYSGVIGGGKNLIHISFQSFDTRTFIYNYAPG